MGKKSRMRHLRLKTTHCVNPEAQEKPRIAACVLLVVKRNKKMPVRAVATAMVIFLPPRANLLPWFFRV